PNVHFLIIGSGGLQGEIERILREDGAAQAVTMPGSIPHSQIPQYLAACDILLSPHVQNTDGTVFFGSPTKLFEYMAAGKAIVASPVGQIGEVLQDGGTALFMTHKDPASLAEKILLLSNDEPLRKALGASARMDVVRNFSWRKNAERVVDAIAPFVLRKS
ncbi:MAG TPA: glycosyltransferase family 4 protein, partial [Bacteroidota bacterium]